jgi:hypothetical protein
MSWYYIFMQVVHGQAGARKTEQFERDFWSGGDLNSLYQSAVNNRHGTGSMERIFEAGFREFTKLRSQKNLDPKDIIDGSRRAMRATYQREVDSIDAHLAFLASVGSVSPYVGLFGTVWGIMHFLPRPVQRRPGDALRRRARASPKRWSPPPSASSPRFRRWSPTTASRTRSTASRRASSRSWKSSRTSCNGRCGKGGSMRQRRLKNEINVVPYIDVMLVLLVIFMVTRR